MTKHRLHLSRRSILAAASTSAAAMLVGGCHRPSEAPSFRNFLASAEWLTYRAQRTVFGRAALAREYTVNDVAPTFRANGSQDAYNLPPDYLEAIECGFESWRLQLVGLVMQPMSLSLADLRALPSQTQITRHDCVEGWSCIGGSACPPASSVLCRAALLATVRFFPSFHAHDFTFCPRSPRSVRHTH